MRADLILKSNNIFTSTSDKPISGGVAIKGNKLLAVGEDFEAFLGPETEVREYGDKLIMPGFIDAHVHYFMAGLAASEHVCGELIASSSEAECAAMIKEFAEPLHPAQKVDRSVLHFLIFPQNRF